VIKDNGALHRFSTNGKASDDAGWYILHTDGVPAGAFGCHRHGIDKTWCARKLSDMTANEREQHRRDKTKCLTHAERERTQAKAQERARHLWQEARLEPGDHHYLRDKGVNAYGIRTVGERLIVPMRDTAGVLHSLQFIDPDGRKRCLAGGRVAGCYHAIGKPNETLCICEGYATGASIHKATAYAVAVAFDARNLEPVAGVLREKFPDVRLILCADDDAYTKGNPGLTKATTAALAVGGLLAVPNFGNDRSEKASDFNDLAQSSGLEAVRACIADAIAPARSKLDSAPTGAVNAKEWPEPLSDNAYHGLAGEIIRTIQPHTESDPAAILIQLLAAFGDCIGNSPHYRVEGNRHTANLFAVLVGNTSKARKGTSWGRITQLVRLVEDQWTETCVQSGLSSGEGLIWAVRDPISRRVRKGTGADAYMDEEEVDGGVSDKRLLVIEEEFASTLRVMGREGNTLSPVMRKAWDGHRLTTMTKNSPACATGAHISIIGHITVDELRRYLDRTECGNGFANRFLFLCVRRSNVLPDGGNLSEDALRPFAEELARTITRARAIEQVKMDDAARDIWHAVYPELSEGLPNLLGAVTSRAEAQVIRLALVYARMDGSEIIGPAHLKAGIAVWEYAEASARYIFGSALGDPVADEIYRALKVASDGLTRTEISNLFKRNKKAETIGPALEALTRAKLARSIQQQTDGRPVEVWRAC
jgi:phage/plasmid primase-like uncharacterized protein